MVSPVTLMMADPGPLVVKNVDLQGRATQGDKGGPVEANPRSPHAALKRLGLCVVPRPTCDSFSDNERSRCMFGTASSWAASLAWGAAYSVAAFFLFRALTFPDPGLKPAPLAS